MEVDGGFCSAAAAFRGTEEYAAAFDLEVWKAQQQARLQSELSGERARLQREAAAEIRKKEGQRLGELDVFRRELEEIAARLRLREEALQKRISQFEAREAVFETRRVKVAEQHEQHLMSLEGRTRRQLEESMARQDVLKSQLKERDGTITFLEGKLRAAESEYDTLQRCMARTVAKDDRARVNALEEQLSAANTALMGLQLQLKERESELAVTRKERDQLEKASKLYKDQLHQLTRRYSELQEKCHQRERMLLDEERHNLEEAKRQHELLALQCGSKRAEIHRYDLLGYQVVENIASKGVKDKFTSYGGKGCVDDYNALVKELQSEVARGLHDLRRVGKRKEKQLATKDTTTSRQRLVYAEVAPCHQTETPFCTKNTASAMARGKEASVEHMRHRRHDVKRDQSYHDDVGNLSLSSLTHRESDGRRESTEPYNPSLVDVPLAREGEESDVDVSSSYCYAEVESWATDGEGRPLVQKEEDVAATDSATNALPPLAPAVHAQSQPSPPLPEDFVQALGAPPPPASQESTRDEMMAFVEKLRANKQKLLESGAYAEDDVLVKEMSDKIALYEDFLLRRF